MPKLSKNAQVFADASIKKNSVYKLNQLFLNVVDEGELSKWGISEAEYFEALYFALACAMNTNDEEKEMEKFKVGDEVGSLTMGHGIIESISSENEYPVRVNFSSEDDAHEKYTSEGKRFISDLNPEIYPLEEFKKRFDSLLYEPLPALGVDAEVWLKIDSDLDSWAPRHFSHFGKDNKMYVFASKGTSHTEHLTVRCDVYSLTEPK